MPGNTNFRKILLNRCQKEFEKEKLDDIQMEQDRNKTFINVSWIYSLCSAFKFSLVHSNLCLNSRNGKAYQR